jgi:hypothetical protein
MSRGKMNRGRCSDLYAHKRLVPNIKSKRCHNGRTFGAMFMTETHSSLVKGEIATHSQLVHRWRSALDVPVG